METGSIILIVSFAVPVLIAGGLLFFLWRRMKKSKIHAEELRVRILQAKPATAVVIAANQSFMGGDIHRIIHLKLQIQDGFSSEYIANATWFINTLHFDKIRVGNAIMVKVDAQNKNIIYPAESWAKFSEGYESNFKV